MTIHKAMIGIMRDVDAIGKDRKNPQQGFMYRGIDDFMNALHPVMSKHGVFMTSEILSKAREERTTAKGGVLIYTMLRMRFTFHAEDGSSVHTEAEGEGMDSGDKSANKAMSIAQKYALAQTFLVPTEDLAEPDADSHEVAPAARTRPPESAPQKKISEAQKKRLEARITQLGVDRGKLKAWLITESKGQVEHFQDMSPALYAQLDAFLDRKARAGAEGHADA